MPFLTAEQAAEVRARFGTPCYVYDSVTLERTARRLLALRLLLDSRRNGWWFSERLEKVEELLDAS